MMRFDPRIHDQRPLTAPMFLPGERSDAVQVRRERNVAGYQRSVLRYEHTVLSAAQIDLQSCSAFRA